MNDALLLLARLEGLLFDPVYTKELMHLGYHDAAVSLLVVVQDCDEQATHRGREAALEPRLFPMCGPVDQIITSCPGSLTGSSGRYRHREGSFRERISSGLYLLLMEA